MMIYYHSSGQMSEVEDSTTHLVVTSPPYPMISKWDELYGVTDFEYQHSILDKTWRECYRILVNGGICCINIGDSTRSIGGKFQCYPNYARVIIKCRELGFDTLIPVFWKKISNRPNSFLGSGFVPPNAYISQDCEYIAILRKGGLRKFVTKDRNRILSMYSKEDRNLWFQQVWNIPGAKGAKNTSVFPREIPYRLIRMFSVIGDLVVDPFCGLGTTGLVAESLGRRFVGYEIKDGPK